MSLMPHRFDRRVVLGMALGGATASWFGMWAPVRRALAEPTPPAGPPRHMAPAAWRALAAVQDHLVPHDDLGPGALDVNAIGYLDAVLGEPGLEQDVGPRLHAGAARLDQLSRRRHDRLFADLPTEAREQVLREMDGQTEGRAWIAEVLAFVLEALLGDPARGANPEGIGWTWLGHEPATPQPPAPGWMPKERA